ncbi:MAG: M13 family peptidase, partial [Sphingomonas sp.]
MRKQVLAALLLASAASGVVYAQTSTQTTAPARPGKPQLGDFGVDLTAMDRSIAPGDDFYNYVNGAWMARTQIPADRASWGGFAILRNLSDERTRAVIEGAAAAPGSDPVATKIGDTYATFMDAAAIESAGAAPLKPYLAKIAAINSQSDLAKAFGEATKHGIDVPIGAGVQQDLKDNTVYAVYLGQGGLGLPDKDYYLKDDPKFAEARTKYVTYIADMMRMAGQPDPQGSAQRVYELEKAIAQQHWDRAELRQVEKGYNPMPVAQLATAMPGFDWQAMLTEQGLGSQTRVIVGQPSALTGTAKIVAATPLSTWKEYLAFHTISNAAPLLSSNFVNTQFAFYGTTLNGTPQLKERWKRGVDLVNGSLGEAVGQIYVQKYFPPEAKAKADELVRNLIAAMDIRLSKLTWMAPETKVKARAKL